MAGQSWPGNVRELHNAVERLAIMAAGAIIGPDDLRATGLLGGEGLTDLPSDDTPHALSPMAIQGLGGLVKARQAFEAACINNCLKETNGNVSGAARLLGIDRTNLHKKIQAYGLGED